MMVMHYEKIHLQILRKKNAKQLRNMRELFEQTEFGFEIDTYRSRN